MLKRTYIIGLFIVLVVFLSGCNTIPENLRLGDEPGPELAAVVKDPALYQGQSVRWGGVIVKVENSAEQSLIELLGHDLNHYARPVIDSRISGRFFVVVDGFVDPLEFAQGRELTVVGTLQASETRKIGEFSYEYPRVNEIAHKLWPERKPIDEVDPFYYYDPFFHYYPWYPYPHWYHDHPPRIIK